MDREDESVLTELPFPVWWRSNHFWRVGRGKTNLISFLKGSPKNHSGRKHITYRIDSEADKHTQWDQVTIVLHHHIAIQFLLKWVEKSPLMQKDLYDHIPECYWSVETYGLLRKIQKNMWKTEVDKMKPCITTIK